MIHLAVIAFIGIFIAAMLWHNLGVRCEIIEELIRKERIEIARNLLRICTVYGLTPLQMEIPKKLRPSISHREALDLCCEFPFRTTEVCLFFGHIMPVIDREQFRRAAQRVSDASTTASSALAAFASASKILNGERK